MVMRFELMIYSMMVPLKAYFENGWLAANLFLPAPRFAGSFRVNLQYVYDFPFCALACAEKV